MKVKIGKRIKDYRTVWRDKEIVNMIDQTKLPGKFEIYKAKNYRETADAIRNMVVRGAPAIGATAAFGMAQAALEFHGSDFEKLKLLMKNAEKIITETRPTAYDLFHAVNFVKKKIKDSNSVREAKEMALIASQEYADKSVENCKRIGEFGEKLIKDNVSERQSRSDICLRARGSQPHFNILTHCNAGALACVDYGTGLAPIRSAHYKKKKIHVFVDETRPRLQGSRLTAWELLQEGISHSIIADNAAGYFMQNGEVDMVIVGADRIAGNGDVANKIGTYEKAVLAKENGIPFYVAAPLTTFDMNCKSGKDIVIEERNMNEVLYIDKIRISPKNSKARNPGFDITPAKYIKGIITEGGILKVGEVRGI